MTSELIKQSICRCLLLFTERSPNAEIAFTGDVPIKGITHGIPHVVVLVQNDGEHLTGQAVSFVRVKTCLIDHVLAALMDDDFFEAF